MGTPFPSPDGAPTPIKPGGSQQPARPTHDMNMGIGESNFESVFSMHTHNGTAASGGNLTGPYFISDSAGKRWKLVVSTAGALSVVKA